MKLNQLPNFRVEDFPSEQAWISKLFTQLNPFIQAVNQVLDLNIDFSSNIKSLTKEYQISSFQSFSFSWPYKTMPPAEVRITHAQKGQALTPCILALSWSYDASQFLITVNSMVELSASGVSSLSGAYKFTLRASI